MVNEGVVGTGLRCGPDVGGQSRSSGWLGYSRRVCLPGGKSITQRHLAASESLQDALLCLATWALHLLFQPVARKAFKERAVSETHAPRLPWWHFPKRRLSPGGGVVG